LTTAHTERAQNDGVSPQGAVVPCPTPSDHDVAEDDTYRLTRSCPGPTLLGTSQAPIRNGVPDKGSARSRPNEGARTVASTVRTWHR